MPEYVWILTEKWSANDTVEIKGVFKELFDATQFVDRHLAKMNIMLNSYWVFGESYAKLVNYDSIAEVNGPFYLTRWQVQ